MKGVSCLCMGSALEHRDQVDGWDRDPFFPFLYETPTEEVKTMVKTDEPTNQPHAPSSRCAVSTLRPTSAFLSSISPFLRGDLCRGRM